jgi:hypothetical protein
MPFDITERVQQSNPTDRVRGTVVNVTDSGIFVVKFDVGDYVAFQPEQAPEFGRIPHLPIPGPALEMIRMLRGLPRLPPEDVGPAQPVRLPGQNSAVRLDIPRPTP